jgi:hypothetical protein
MDMDTDKIDDMILALLWLGAHGDGMATRAWKSFDWAALNRLHAKGLITNPVGKAKSVGYTEEGLRRSQDLFETLFTRKEPSP